MNNYYCELNLPPVLSGTEAIKKIYDFKRSIQRSYVGILTDFNDLLNPELLEAFKQLNINPVVMIAFGHQANSNFIMKPYVHTDLSRTKDGWVKLPLSINWEVYDTAVEFNWYDTLVTKECYPPDINTEDPVYLYGNGINYGERYVSGKPTPTWNPSWDFKPVQTHIFKHNHATLINTSIPHSAIYSGLENRLNISLRFDINVIPTWESALERFKSCI